MLITFNYKKWTPPKLSREEEARIGAQICAHGRQHWLDEFDTKSKEGGFSQEPVWVILVILAAVIFVIVLLPPIIVLVPIWFAVYLGSAAIARYRFSRWLDRCVAAWQATSPPNPTTSFTPTALPKPVEPPRHQPAANPTRPNDGLKIDFTGAESRAVQAALEPYAGSYLSPKAYSGVTAVALSQYSMSLVTTHMHEFSAARGGASMAAKLAIEKALSGITKAYKVYQLPVFLFYKAGIYRLLGQEDDAKPLFARFLVLQADFKPDQVDEAFLSQVCNDIQEAIAAAKR